MSCGVLKALFLCFYFPASTAKMGLVETKLAIIPGGGKCQSSLQLQWHSVLLCVTIVHLLISCSGQRPGTPIIFVRFLFRCSGQRPRTPLICDSFFFPFFSFFILLLHLSVPCPLTKTTFTNSYELETLNIVRYSLGEEKCISFIMMTSSILELWKVKVYYFKKS